MTMAIRAIYENGVFKPKKPVDLQEKTEVEVLIPTSAPADADDPTGWKTVMERRLRVLEAAHGQEVQRGGLLELRGHGEARDPRGTGSRRGLHAPLHRTTRATAAPVTMASRASSRGVRCCGSSPTP